MSGNKGMNMVQYYSSLIWKRVYINIELRGGKMTFQPHTHTHTHTAAFNTEHLKCGVHRDELSVCVSLTVKHLREVIQIFSVR